MESWTDCPVCSGFFALASLFMLGLVGQEFQKHIAAFHQSDAFKAKAKDAAPFFQDIKDYIFGRPATLENIVRLHSILHYVLPDHARVP